jgi:putative addiction module component (TIGR02574 family)
MTRRELVEEALKLPPEERAELVEALQVSLLDAPLAGWQRELLDERLAEHERDPEDATPWEEVRARLRRDSAE